MQATDLNEVSVVSDFWSRRAGAFILHTTMVFACAIVAFPWLIWRWFIWVEPYVHVPLPGPPLHWYLQNLVLVNLIMAVAVGYGMTRGLKTAAVWAWTIPALVLGVKMLAFSHPASISVLFQASAKLTAFEYFFGILPGASPDSGSTNDLPFNLDYERILAQMRYTASFCAGAGYTLGALAARHQILTKMFVFEKPAEEESAPASSDASEVGK